LITSARWTRNPKLAKIGSKGAPAKYVKYIRPVFLIFIFFPGLAYWSDPHTMTYNGSKHVVWRKYAVCAFCGPPDGRQHFFGFKCLNCQKWPSVGIRSIRSERIQDEWRYRRLISLASFRRSLSVIGRAVYTIYSILAICCFSPNDSSTTQRKYQLMHYNRYGNSVSAKFIQYL